MKCTLENLELVLNTIQESHEDNQRTGEYDNETDLLDAVKRTIEGLTENQYMCNSCHELFYKHEIDFDVDDDQDLCKTCNYQNYEDRYGSEIN